MARVMLSGGRPILVGGKVAMSSACCCGGSGACCILEECSIHTAADCAALGGDYDGDGTLCASVSCSQGACCYDDLGDCILTRSKDCPGDNWQGEGTVCDPNPCDLGACCLNVDECQFVTATVCSGLHGYFQGVGIPCSPDPCEGSCCNGPQCFVTHSAACIALDNDCSTRACASGYAFTLGIPCDFYGPGTTPCCTTGCVTCCFDGSTNNCDQHDYFTALACTNDGGTPYTDIGCCSVCCDEF